MYKKYDILNNTGWIDCNQQKIYSRGAFHGIMNDFIKVGWVKCRSKRNGIILNKQYTLTFDGYFIVHSIFYEVVSKCQ